MSKVDAKRCREESMDLVVELCEEKIVQKMMMVMCRCGGVLSLAIDRVASGMTLALLPC